MEPIALSPKDAFASIGVGTTKGYELIANGDLSAFKVGRATRITTESVRSYVARQLQAQQEAA
ncbi:helix-turn-helix domain-containing protein [Pontixanthobacter sp. CEM42]|uniref:helix-turn-helix domain-containing protein n=1 Tax=Pontixanthobacter sp. CEM42 TaxID=2792077 RepID=UPI001ADEF1F4|nr:helix-turn-helix domain-containing protein [Pontixanthobacter sp. CEM42]